MKTKVIDRNRLTFVAAVFVLSFASVAYSHCQVPCGIYDDEMRFEMIAEHITTIEKSMKMINQLSAEKTPETNQLVRWVNNKETHADKLSDIITYYFIAQRIKPADRSDAKEYQKYQTKLTLLHKMLVATMKAKQTTNLAIPKQLTELTANFKKAYYQAN